MTASTERIWLASYPPGIPSDIDPDKYPNINAVMDEACKLYGDRPAFTRMVNRRRLASLMRPRHNWPVTCAVC